MTRLITEQTFGIQKSHFHCLDHSRGALQYAPKKMADIIKVCCMLHNNALKHSMPNGGDPDLTPEPLICLLLLFQML